MGCTEQRVLFLSDFHATASAHMWQSKVLFWELDGTASAYCGAMLEVHCMCCFYPDRALREKGPGGGCSACSDLASSVPAVMLCTCACSWLGSRQISALWAYALMMN